MPGAPWQFGCGEGLGERRPSLRKRAKEPNSPTRSDGASPLKAREGTQFPKEQPTSGNGGDRPTVEGPDRRFGANEANGVNAEPLLSSGIVTRDRASVAVRANPISNPFARLGVGLSASGASVVPERSKPIAWLGSGVGCGLAGPGRRAKTARTKPTAGVGRAGGLRWTIWGNIAECRGLEQTYRGRDRSCGLRGRRARGSTSGLRVVPGQVGNRVGIFDEQGGSP